MDHKTLNPPTVPKPSTSNTGTHGTSSNMEGTLKSIDDHLARIDKRLSHIEVRQADLVRTTAELRQLLPRPALGRY